MAVQRREAFRDYVKEQGKLVSQVLKERTSAEEWEKNWGFYKAYDKILEEEAIKKGIEPEKYWSLVESLQTKPYTKNQTSYPTNFTNQLPQTSNAMYGWRHNFKIDKRNPPSVAPLPLPEKQNVIFLG